MPLFNGHFDLCSHVFNGSKRFYLYICGVFLCFLPFIQQHFALYLAPFYLAFSTKTHCIQHQNALRLAAYYTAFCSKTHYILLQIAKKRVLVAVSLNNYSFCLHVQLTLFCIKTNLRENRLFAARWAIVGENCTHNVKFLTENKTKQIVLCTYAKATATESMYAYNRQRELLQGMLPTANGNSIMQTQK